MSVCMCGNRVDDGYRSLLKSCEECKAKTMKAKPILANHRNALRNSFKPKPLKRWFLWCWIFGHKYQSICCSTRCDNCRRERLRT